MDNIKISLITPTRSRPGLLRGFIESIQLCTAVKNRVELIVICDEEDVNSQEYTKALMKQYNEFEIRLLTRPQSEALNNDYYNWGAKQASGDLIWICADDLAIVAPNWDRTVVQHYTNFCTKYPDKIFCISIKDNTPSPSHRIPKFPCFPMFPKEVLNCFGWYLIPEIMTWGCDYVTYKIYSSLGRILEIHDRNYVNHVSFHNKQVEQDAVNLRIGRIFDKFKHDPIHSTDVILSTRVIPMQHQIQDYVENWKKSQEQTLVH